MIVCCHESRRDSGQNTKYSKRSHCSKKVILLDESYE